MSLEHMSIAGTTIWSPLASGVLSGKYSKGNVPSDSRLALEAYKVFFYFFLSSTSCVYQHTSLASSMTFEHTENLKPQGSKALSVASTMPNMPSPSLPGSAVTYACYMLSSGPHMQHSLS